MVSDLEKHGANRSVEEWRPIAGRLGYEVSNHGRVRSYVNSHGAIGRRSHPLSLRQKTDRNRVPYVWVRFGAADKQDEAYVAHLVLEAFVGPRPAGLNACHNDSDPTNNRVENLRWDTQSNNLADRLPRNTHPWGENTHLHKLTEELVRQIRASDRSDESWATELGVHRQTIRNARVGKTWTYLKEVK